MDDHAFNWKFGFLAKCAADGLTVAQTHELVRARIKQADPDYGRMIGDTAIAARTLMSPIKGLGMAAMRGLTDYAAPLAGLGAAGVGGGLGLLAAKMQDDDVDPHEVRKRELINTYRHYADQLEAQRRMANGGGMPG